MFVHLIFSLFLSVFYSEPISEILLKTTSRVEEQKSRNRFFSAHSLLQYFIRL